MTEYWSDLLAQATVDAGLAHSRQKRHDGEPYIFHAYRVQALLDRRDMVGRVVAMLHDVKEDHPEFILLGYPHEVLNALGALSHKHGLTRDEYIEHIKDDVLPNAIARRVKLADLTDNMRDLPTGRQWGKTNWLKYREAKSLIEEAEKE